MIKLFRNIRENLLAEGKTSKYLKYAIGEIILVVIGILIALQINNWNEHQKQNKQQTIYLQNLKDDLSSQIQYLDVAIDFENFIIQNCKDIVEHYNRNNGFENMDSIYPKLNDLTVRWTFVNANSTLLEMINSGQINLISNKSLKKELTDFNQILQGLANRTNNNNTNLIDNLIVQNVINGASFAYSGYSETFQKQFQNYNSINPMTISDAQLLEIANQNLNEPKFRLLLFNNVVFRSGLATGQKTGDENLKQKAIELKKRIEIELNPL